MATIRVTCPKCSEVMEIETRTGKVLKHHAAIEKKPEDESLTAATTDYGVDFESAVSRDNLFAVQFHPEKSADAGLQLLENFVNWEI